MSAGRFDWRAVVSRALFSLFIVFAVYNPSGYSYLHWVLHGFEWFWAKLAVGTLLVIIVRMLWRTVRGVLKTRGTILVGVLCATSGLALAPLAGGNVLSLDTVLIWALVSLAILFTVALCYSHLHHRLGGISHTEEISP
jgi:hypothetical protein